MKGLGGILFHTDAVVIANAEGELAAVVVVDGSGFHEPGEC